MPRRLGAPQGFPYGVPYLCVEYSCICTIIMNIDKENGLLYIKETITKWDIPYVYKNYYYFVLSNFSLCELS